jgi:tRNA wybutosine-synthesizing protein 4
MKSSESSSVIRWAGETFETAGFVTYEQIVPHDAFGQEMVSNLSRRGCPLLSIFEFPDEEAQRKRYQELGWRRVEAINMKTLYQSARFFDPQEHLRVNRLEIFDELEEWYLIQSHYCIVLALNDPVLSATAASTSSSSTPSTSFSSSILPLVAPSTGPRTTWQPYFQSRSIS